MKIKKNKKIKFDAERLIKTEIAVAIVLFLSSMALWVITMSQNSVAGQESKGVIVVNQQQNQEPKKKVYRKLYDFDKYGLNLKLRLADDVVANDYGDGLILFVVKERTTKEGGIAYQGAGFPIVGIKVSDDCQKSEFLCQDLEKIEKQKSPSWVIKKDEEGNVISAKRKNVYLKEYDGFDNYYLKVGSKVISMYYEYQIDQPAVVEGVDRNSLSKLPNINEEQQKMKKLMDDLVRQLGT